MSSYKITPKRTTLWQKTWYILKPFVIYMVVKTFAMLTLAMVISMLPVKGIDLWVEEHSYQLSAVVNAAASLVGAGFLLEDFLKEVAVTGEIDIDARAWKRLCQWIGNGFRRCSQQMALGLSACAAGGAIFALAFNYLIAFVSDMLAVESQKYESVEAIQYSVPLWLGLILYGLISPVVEEMVFRGVLYNRMKRFYSVPRSVILTALLFGIFHANLPQFVYGTCMGILMALAYEKLKCFVAPVVFHMAANISVFLLSFI